MSTFVLGLDIGGANIKAADADGNTHASPFPMWTDFKQLATRLSSIGTDHFQTPDIVALTMTAELADCFESKQEGVEFVIEQVTKAFPGIPVRVWLTTGEFAKPEDAVHLPTLVGAANWHALATWAGRASPAGPAILMDVGSTTTDIIPIINGLPIPYGLSDVERLLSGELVYCGVGRTPICAVARSVPLRDQFCPLAAEHFATIADALLVAEFFEEDESAVDTADGRPFTRANSRNRLAHMVCCDATELSEAEIRGIADAIVEQATTRILNSFQRVFDRLVGTLTEGQKEEPCLILSGSGAGLADRVAEEFGTDRFADRIFLPDMFHAPVSESACAFAVARLAHDRCRDDLLDTSNF